MNKSAYIFFFFFCSLQLLSQSVKFSWPIDSPCVLTGNYGELRPNHFHAGIDFATGGQVNQPVYCVAEGYVSRIKVSSTGYGKCVYVTHPNGKVTLYGHLNSYSIKLGAIVAKEQAAQQSYEVEMFPKPNTIFVRRGEILGLSGSTGSSTGPHLHFEIRDERTEAPLNPLEYYRYPDNVKPVVQWLGIYNLADTLVPKLFKTIKVSGNDDDILLPETQFVYVDQSVLGLSFAGFDRFAPAGSINNIYAVKVFFDGKLIYAHKLNGIKFDDTRYVNEFSETVGQVKYQKCFLPTLYPAEMVQKAVNKGRIVLPDSALHTIKLLVSDESGNQNDVQFHIRTNHLNTYARSAARNELFVNCSRDFAVRKDDLYIKIPAATLYYSVQLAVENKLESLGKLNVQPEDANLRNAVTLGFKAPQRHEKNKSRLVLKSGQIYYTPSVKNDSVFFAIKNLGSFSLEEDVLGPRIVSQLRTRKGRKMFVSNVLSFTITDAQSGIGKYKLFLNGQWVLAEYDAKNDLLTCRLDENSPRGRIGLRLEVEDRVGNKSKFECNIKR